MENKTYQCVDEIIEKYRAAGYFKQAACAVFDKDGILHTYGAGGADEKSLFDLASLTKLFTATIILKLIDEGKIGLHEKIGRYLLKTEKISDHLPKVCEALKQISVYQLLTHTSGLIAWHPFYAEPGSFYEILERLIELPLKQDRVVYSDLSFILLGQIVCAVTGMSLEVAAETYVRRPLGLETLMYCPNEKDTQKEIVTSCDDNEIEENMCAERGIDFDGFRPHDNPVTGDANDGNCWYYFHGMSGHAGLFSDARSVARLGMFYLKADDMQGRDVSVFSEAQRPLESTRGLGFDTGALYPSGCGHTGFTGTSLYISKENNIGLVLLTNRLTCKVDGKAPDLSAFRQAAAEAVLEAHGFIRPAALSDVTDIARIYKGGLWAAYKDILPETYFESVTIESAVGLWKKNLARTDYHCLVWEENKNIAGFISFKPDEEREDTIMLAALYVDEKYKGKSIGTRLIKEVHRRARLDGYTRVAITVVLKNTRAKALYEHLGAAFEKTTQYHFGEIAVQCGRYVWKQQDIS